MDGDDAGRVDCSVPRHLERAKTAPGEQDRRNRDGDSDTACLYAPSHRNSPGLIAIPGQQNLQKVSDYDFYHLSPTSLSPAVRWRSLCPQSRPYDPRVDWGVRGLAREDLRESCRDGILRRASLSLPFPPLCPNLRSLTDALPSPATSWHSSCVLSSEPTLARRSCSSKFCGRPLSRKRHMSSRTLSSFEGRSTLSRCHRTSARSVGPSRLRSPGYSGRRSCDKKALKCRRSRSRRSTYPSC